MLAAAWLNLPHRPVSGPSGQAGTHICGWLRPLLTISQFPGAPVTLYRVWSWYQWCWELAWLVNGGLDWHVAAGWRRFGRRGPLPARRAAWSRCEQHVMAAAAGLVAQGHRQVALAHADRAVGDDSFAGGDEAEPARSADGGGGQPGVAAEVEALEGAAQGTGRRGPAW